MVASRLFGHVGNSKNIVLDYILTMYVHSVNQSIDPSRRQKRKEKKKKK